MELVVSDETLRDGEQQIGVNFSSRSKLQLAKQIAAIGVDHIDTMPAISVYEEIFVKGLASSEIKNKLYAATMLGRKHVDHCIALGVKNLILFSSLSDRLLGLRGVTRDQNIESAVAACRYAKSKKMNVVFAGEDATRADPYYTAEFIGRIERYIDGFLLCDTVGILDPKSTASFVKNIARQVKCPLGAHFHNDRGLADKNTIEAVKNGVSIISATFGGIGERAGNADICNVLLSLKEQGIKSDKIDYSQLRSVRKAVYRHGGSHPAKPYSERAFWHESGIHVHALLKDPLSYNSFSPEEYGHKNKFFFGKFSGTSSYRYLLGYDRPEEHMVRIRDHLKELAHKRGRSFSEAEARRLIESIKL